MPGAPTSPPIAPSAPEPVARQQGPLLDNLQKWLNWFEPDNFTDFPGDPPDIDWDPPDFGQTG
jgi:hypothetical protein